MSRRPQGCGEDAADTAGRPRRIRRTDLLFPADGADALEEAVLDTTLETMDVQVIAESAGKKEIPFELFPPQRRDLGCPGMSGAPPVLPTAIALAFGP